MINARRAVTQQPESIDKKEDPIHSLYMESVHLLERLHRRLLDVVKDEFERNGRSDINAVQALLLFNIGDSELTAGELGDGISIVQLIVRSGLAKSGKDAKRLIAENGARLDDAPLTDAGLMIDAGALRAPIKLSAGKKRHALVKIG